MDKKELFKSLKNEMAQCGRFTVEDVYNELKEIFFITSKQELKKICEFGVLNYDYTYYKRVKQFFSDKDILNDILNLIRNKTADVEYFSEIINENYCNISDSFRHFAENALINNYEPPEQGNIKMQYLFNLINTVVEVYIKPQILLHYNLFCNKERTKTLGEMVGGLSEFDPVYKFIFNEYLNDININQWRNIAEHKSYRMDRSEDIHITYSNGRVNKVIQLKDLEEITIKIDTLGCLFRLIYDVMFIEYHSLFDEKILELHQESVPVDCFEGKEIILMEISKNNGIEILSSEYKMGVYFLTLKTFVELQKEDITEYINKMSIIIPCDNFEIIIKNSKGKVAYTVNIKNKIATIFKWKT